MGTTFLDLTNKVLKRLNEVALTQANFGSVSGLPRLAQQAVNEAIRRINLEEYQWPFNYTSGSFTLVQGQQEYSLPADMQSVDWDTVYLQKDASLNVGGNHLKYLSYEQWTQDYRGSDEETIANIANITSTPDRVFATPDDKMGFTPVPSAAYTVAYDYWAVPTELTAYNDTTTIPSRFDNVIIDGAMVQMHRMRDNYEMSNLVEDDFQRGLKAMRSQIINKFAYVHDTRTRHALRSG